MNESLQFAIARSKLVDFNDRLMADHCQAMACRECEEELAELVGVYEWLRDGEITLREAHHLGLVEITDETRQNIANLYNIWLTAAEQAEEMVQQQLSSGFDVDGLGEFRDCQQKVREWVSETTWQACSNDHRLRRWSEEPW